MDHLPVRNLTNTNRHQLHLIKNKNSKQNMEELIGKSPESLQIDAIGYAAFLPVSLATLIQIVSNETTERIQMIEKNSGILELLNILAHRPQPHYHLALDIFLKAQSFSVPNLLRDPVRQVEQKWTELFQVENRPADDFIRILSALRSGSRGDVESYIRKPTSCVSLLTNRTLILSGDDLRGYSVPNPIQEVVLRQVWAKASTETIEELAFTFGKQNLHPWLQRELH